MLSGYIKIDNTRKVFKIDSNFNIVKYIDLKKDHLITNMDESDIFQHDGATDRVQHNRVWLMKVPSY